MKSTELREFLSGSVGPLETLRWLQQQFLPLIVNKLNHRDSRKRLALYGNDRIPENERNLTDFRNRISLVIEYEFARMITLTLREDKISDLFCAYVVANRFPDLEIRNNDGRLGLRFEVKCLQSIAEEKSANFSTLRKDIQPSTDFIVVFLWDWLTDISRTRWDRAPNVLDAYVFNASTLATLRDWYWLNRPPPNLGKGYQGFDVRFAVNCTEGEFNEEEGNFGKLLRLWKRDFSYKPTGNGVLEQTESDYNDFKATVINRGFETLAHQFLPMLSGVSAVSKIKDGQQWEGFKSSKMGFLLASSLSNSGRVKKKKLQRIMNDSDLQEVWVLRDMYQWRHYRLLENGIELIDKGNKPKEIKVTASRPVD